MKTTLKEMAVSHDQIPPTPGALNVHMLMQSVATGTNVEIRDEILEGRLYYHGTVRGYFEKVTPLLKLYVHNISIKDEILVITALDHTL